MSAACLAQSDWFLTCRSLYNNNFTGSLPAQWSSLDKLQKL